MHANLKTQETPSYNIKTNNAATFVQLKTIAISAELFCNSMKLRHTAHYFFEFLGRSTQGFTMLTAAIISSLATVSRSTLLVHGRGMACAIWDTGGKPAEDCIHHKAPGALYPVSFLLYHPVDFPGFDSAFRDQPNTYAYDECCSQGPWVGSLDPSTGTMAAIPGVTTFFGSVEDIHSNFLSLSSTESLGYVILNATSGWYTTQLSLPAQKGDSGAVKVLGKVTSAYWPPAWTALGGPHNIIGWTEIEFHSTASQGVRVQETLQLFDTHGELTATLANLSAHGTDTHMAIPHYGFEHAVDTTNNLLYTQSQNQSVRVLDFQTNRTLPNLPNTAGKFFICLHFDSSLDRLGAIMATGHGANQRLELVAVDVHTGVTTTRASWNQSSFLDKLHFLRHDDRSVCYSVMVVSLCMHECALYSNSYRAAGYAPTHGDQSGYRMHGNGNEGGAGVKLAGCMCIRGV